MRIIFILFIGLLFITCAPKIVNQSTTKIKDSLVVITKTIYDTVRVNKDSVGISWVNTIETDSTFEEVTEKKSGRADLKIIKSHGKIIANCRCDSLTIVKKFLSRDTLHNITTTVKDEATKLVQYTSGFDKFCRWFFIAVCIAAGVTTMLKLRKFIV